MSYPDVPDDYYEASLADHKSAGCHHETGYIVNSGIEHHYCAECDKYLGGITHDSRDYFAHYFAASDDNHGGIDHDGTGDSSADHHHDNDSSVPTQHTASGDCHDHGTG